MRFTPSPEQQQLSELMMLAVGPYALPFRPEAMRSGFAGAPVGPGYAAPLAATYLNYRKTSIYGGPHETQKNIIARALLGL